MKNLIFLLFVILSFESFAKLKVQKVEYSNANSKEGQIVIHFTGKLRAAPELKVRNELLQVSLPDTVVWPQIDKKVSVMKKFDTSLKAYQYDSQTVRVRASLPYNVSRNLNRVNLTIKDDRIVLNFPKKKVVTAVKKIKKSVVKKAVSAKKKAVKKDKLDESYLDYLIEEKEKNIAPKQMAKGMLAKDEVSTQKAAPTKDLFLKDEPVEEKKFSIMSYIGKYIAFLGLILLGIYGVVVLMKKGVLKKGKLGFLNQTDMVSVLNTTYIAPKKSIVMVKVHDKTLLLGNSDSGLTFLTELNDTTGILKEGEKKISGSNFDTTVDSINMDNIETKVQEKENPFLGQGQLNTVKSAEKVSFSNQMKEKIKNLKPLNQ